MAEGKKGRGGAKASAPRTEIQKSDFVVGKCVRVSIEIRTRCKDGDGKPRVRLAQAKAASSQESAPVMHTMSGGPIGGGGGGVEPLVSLNITIDVEGDV
jgi:hypothetical protein